jgi:hypothetical protein
LVRRSSRCSHSKECSTTDRIGHANRRNSEYSSWPVASGWRASEASGMRGLASARAVSLATACDATPGDEPGVASSKGWTAHNSLPNRRTHFLCKSNCLPVARPHRLLQNERSWNEAWDYPQDAVPRDEPVWLKVLLTFWPRVVTTVMQATRISASMTAYSTAVGPSSLTRKARTFNAKLLILLLSLHSK